MAGAEQTVPAFGGAGGKDAIMPLGQTEGSYGNEPNIKREYGGENKESPR